MCVLPAISSAIVSAGVQKDDIGANASVGNAVCCAGDLIDHPARVTLIVLVCHGARLHRADIVGLGAGGAEGIEKKLTVAVGGRGTDAVLLRGGKVRSAMMVDIMVVVARDLR